MVHDRRAHLLVVPGRQALTCVVFGPQDLPVWYLVVKYSPVVPGPLLMPVVAWPGAEGKSTLLVSWYLLVSVELQ